MADQQNNNDPAARRANDPARKVVDPNAPRNVRVRLLQEREVDDPTTPGKKRTLAAGTAISVSEDEARSMVEGGDGVLAPYGQSDATSGPDEDAQQLQERSAANEREQQEQQGAQGRRNQGDRERAQRGRTRGDTDQDR